MGIAAQNRAQILPRRIAAAAVCLALLYFAAGGSLLHEHKSGPETVCHVCHSLHAPALAVQANGLARLPELAGWRLARPVAIAAIDEFSFHPSGRAPPSL
jgi:hypothetical protein